MGSYAEASPPQLHGDVIHPAIVIRADIIDGIMERIIVQMEPDTISELDQAARESRMSRAAFVRASVEAVLADGRRRKELKQVVDSYIASPQEDFTVSKETLQDVWPE